jgi:hypothetical protein
MLSVGQAKKIRREGWGIVLGWWKKGREKVGEKVFKHFFIIYPFQGEHKEVLKGGWLQTNHSKKVNELKERLLTNNIHHVFVPLLQLALYESTLLDTTKVRTIRHFSMSTSCRKLFSIVS